uniref:Cysteine-rich receptor-like protein kinase n=1 Tax=Tanacetum cinerariifolium TaxID=118510 RepID=A0A6L2NCR7_TANCI|nr:cysteine-rich receptor-like protein kinase [Tanacetum cinerariifolium]
MLAKRVKKVVGNVVGDVQNAFIKGRYILDGVLVANETMEFLNKNKEKQLIFKVSFEKACDSINWRYLLNIMKKIGFRVKWCKWVEVSLHSPSMLILVNGSPIKEFGLERGVRQGDPISPFLFNLAAEGVNEITTEAVERGIFKRIRSWSEKIRFGVKWCKFTLVLNVDSCNGSPIEESGLERGVRQGDSLSPFLFVSLRNIKVKQIMQWSLYPFWSLGLKPKLKLSLTQDKSPRCPNEGVNAIISEVVERGIFKGIMKGSKKENGGGGLGGKEGVYRDKWRWTLNRDGKFLVKDLSRIVKEKILGVETGSQEMIWNKLVPKKVNIFVWKVLKGRIPVRDELDKIGNDLDSVLFPCCDSVVESCAHTLVLCDLARGVWEKSYLVEG